MRGIFKEAFERVGLPYFNPHSFRNTLAILGEKICKTAEQWKAYSQNFGHSSPMTTFTSYGEVPPYRQAELLRDLAEPKQAGETTIQTVVLDDAQVLRIIKGLGEAGESDLSTAIQGLAYLAWRAS